MANSRCGVRAVAMSPAWSSSLPTPVSPAVATVTARWDVSTPTAAAPADFLRSMPASIRVASIRSRPLGADTLTITSMCSPPCSISPMMRATTWCSPPASTSGSDVVGAPPGCLPATLAVISSSRRPKRANSTTFSSFCQVTECLCIKNGNNIEVDPNIYKNEQPTLVAHFCFLMLVLTVPIVHSTIGLFYCQSQGYKHICYLFRDIGHDSL